MLVWALLKFWTMLSRLLGMVDFNGQQLRCFEHVLIRYG